MPCWVIAGEHVRLSLQAPVADNVVPCRVERMRRLGEIVTLECRVSGPPAALLHLELTTRYAVELGLQPGATVFLQLEAEGIHVMPVRTGGP